MAAGVDRLPRPCYIYIMQNNTENQPTGTRTTDADEFDRLKDQELVTGARGYWRDDDCPLERMDRELLDDEW